MFLTHNKSLATQVFQHRHLWLQPWRDYWVWLCNSGITKPEQHCILWSIHWTTGLLAKHSWGLGGGSVGARSGIGCLEILRTSWEHFNLANIKYKIIWKKENLTQKFLASGIFWLNDFSKSSKRKICIKYIIKEYKNQVVCNELYSYTYTIE